MNPLNNILSASQVLLDLEASSGRSRSLRLLDHQRRQPGSQRRMGWQRRRRDWRLVSDWPRDWRPDWLPRPDLPLDSRPRLG